MFFKRVEAVNISIEQLREKVRAKDDFYLLDVRAQVENVSQAIPGSHHIPLQELGNRVWEIPKDKEIVVYCRIGNRSAYASDYLAREGYHAKNLTGGIQAWNKDVNI